MDHQPLRRKYGSAHHPILVAKCALSRPADDVETRTPRHWKDAASRKILLGAIESRSCFSLWKVNQKDHNLYVRPLSSNAVGFVNATNGNYVSVFAGELQFSVDSDVIFHAVQRGVLVSSALI